MIMKIQNVHLVLPTKKKDMNGEKRIVWQIGESKQVNIVLEFWDIRSHAKCIVLIYVVSFFFKSDFWKKEISVEIKKMMRNIVLKEVYAFVTLQCVDSVTIGHVASLQSEKLKSCARKIKMCQV